ncbi:MAG TPA: hypothetical protein VGC81_07390 [Candidatus Methylomirabilis sp.]
MRVTRRSALKLMGGMAGVAARRRLGWAAERGPVRVGFIAPFSGPFAHRVSAHRVSGTLPISATFSNYLP